jgi:hypothetical protein
VITAISGAVPELIQSVKHTPGFREAGRVEAWRFSLAPAAMQGIIDRQSRTCRMQQVGAIESDVLSNRIDEFARLNVGTHEAKWLDAGYSRGGDGCRHDP